jgi:anti-anti-sigma factor
MIECSRQTDGTLTMRVKGKFNFTCYQQFNEAVSGPVPSRYLVDLSATEYMDSSALGMLLLLRDKVEQDSARVKILSGAGQPHEILKLANFQRLFDVV